MICETCGKEQEDRECAECGYYSLSCDCSLSQDLCPTCKERLCESCAYWIATQTMVPWGETMVPLEGCECTKGYDHDCPDGTFEEE